MNLIEAIKYLKKNTSNRVTGYCDLYKFEGEDLYKSNTHDENQWSRIPVDSLWVIDCIFEIYTKEKLYSFSEMLEEIVAIKNIGSSVDFISMVNKDVVVGRYRNTDKIVFGDNYIDYEIPINCYHGKWMRKIG